MAFLSFTDLSCQEAPTEPMPVLVCYGKVNPDKIRGYKYVIVESEQYSAFDVKLLKENNEVVLGYLSVGEVDTNRDYYAEIKDKTLGKNEVWGSYYLDLSDEATQKTLIDEAGEINKKGFDGLFLDTVDTFAEWGPYPEKGDELIYLLKLLKEAFPDIYLMQNAGLSLVPASAKYVDALAIESVASDYSHAKDQYKLRKNQEFYEIVERLKKLERKHKLPVILIEYADSKKLLNKVKHQIQSLEWDYFVGTVDLQNLPKFK